MLNAEYRGRMQLLALQVGEPIKVGDHAGPFETSDMLAAAPELVHFEPALPIPEPDQAVPVQKATLASEKRPGLATVCAYHGFLGGNANLAGIIAYCREWLSREGLLSQEG